MDVNQKYQIVEKIIQTDNEFLLNEVRELLGLSGDFSKVLPNEVIKTIHEAKIELEKGGGVDHDKVMQEARQRYLK